MFKKNNVNDSILTKITYENYNMTFAEKYARIVAFGVQSDPHCCKDFQAPKGIASECQSNCRSKLSMHLNSLFPEKDKDTKLQNRNLEDE